MQLQIFGSNFSPFSRRLTLAFDLLEVPYQQTVLGTAGGKERLQQLHPQARLPVLKVDGESLYDSSIIVEWINRTFSPSLFPTALSSLQKQGIGVSLIEKAVSLFYELTRRDEPFRSPKIIEYTTKQICNGFEFLEEFFKSEVNWVNGTSPSHADIAVFVAFQFTNVAIPEVMQTFPLPKLKQFEEFCLKHPAFAENILPPSPISTKK